MIFQSRWPKATYIVRPTAVELYPGIGRKVTPGLRAEFEGRNRLFDSMRAQNKFKWSDEERIQVETHLMTHKDFGRGLYLAPGEEVPDYLADYKPEEKPAAIQRCAFLSIQNGEISQCENEAMLGLEFCPEHRTDQPRIKPGMATTQNTPN